MKLINYYSLIINFVNCAIEEHKVTNLPGTSEDNLNFDHYSGYLDLGEFAGDSRYFYWLFHNKKFDKDNNKKLLIWLNGGPGCTSADGIILEKGIFNISGDLDSPSEIKLRALEDGWHSFTKVLMVDQPLGTGYSVGQQKFYAKDVNQASEYFAMFLKQFLDKYPEYKDNEVYLGGESWAGVWIPYIADKLIKTNSEAKLKGMMIGNGWMDPFNQYSSYIPYIEKHDILPKDQLDKLKAKYKESCEPRLAPEAHKLRIEQCEAIISELTEYSVRGEDKDKTCVNLYDIRLRDSYPACGMEWPPNVGLFRAYMARPEVATALHGELPKDHKWQECDATVYQVINKDPSKPPIELIPELLKTLKLYLFVGDQDLMTPITGIEQMVQNLVKQYPKSIQNKEEAQWYHEETGSAEGKIVIYPALNITFASVFDGSHMVSFDKPSEVSGLFKYFMNGQDRLVDSPSFFLGAKRTEAANNDDEQHVISITDDASTPDTNVKTASNFYFYIPILIILLGVTGGVVWFIFNRNQHKNYLDIHRPTDEEGGLINGEDEILLSDRGGFMDGYEDDDDEDDDF